MGNVHGRISSLLMCMMVLLTIDCGLDSCLNLDLIARWATKHTRKCYNSTCVLARTFSWQLAKKQPTLPLFNNPTWWQSYLWVILHYWKWNDACKSNCSVWKHHMIAANCALTLLGKMYLFHVEIRQSGRIWHLTSPGWNLSCTMWKPPNNITSKKQAGYYQVKWMLHVMPEKWM